MGPDLGGREGRYFLTCWISHFPKGCRWLQESLPEARFPIYLPIPSDAFLRDWCKNLLKVPTILWGERIDTSTWGGKRTEIGGFITGLRLRHHYSGREGMSWNWERGICQETLPGEGCLWRNLGNKRQVCWKRNGTVILGTWTYKSHERMRLLWRMC